MALFLGSQGSDAAKLRATGEVLERLRQTIATAQGMGDEAAVTEFLAGLATDFAEGSAAELAFLHAHGGVLAAVATADAAALPAIIRLGRRQVADEFDRRRSPLAVHVALGALDEAVLRRVFTLAGAPADDSWCWLAGGWLGRCEVSFGAGLAGTYLGRDPEGMANRVLPLLEASGYQVEYRPVCGGLSWYAGIDAWQEALAALFAAGNERCAALADLRWVAGNPVLGQTALNAVRSGLARWRQSALFSQAAREASNLRVALGFFGGLKVERVGEHRGAINIDSQALYPLVANIRFMAIAYGVAATDTAERLRELVRLGRLNVDPAGRIIEAYHHLLCWKMATMPTADAIAASDRYIWPERLTEREQESLKECLDAVAGLERQVVQQLVGMG
jgi:hypothetical protein